MELPRLLQRPRRLLGVARHISNPVGLLVVADRNPHIHLVRFISLPKDLGHDNGPRLQDEKERTGMAQALRFYRRGEAGELIPWDFVVEGNVILEEKRVEGAIATPAEEANLPRATQLQLADFRARGIKYMIKNGTPHIISVPPVELLLDRFFNEKEPCFFEGCEELRQQWIEFRTAAEEADPGCNTSCANNKMKRQFREKVLPVITKHDNDSKAQQGSASQAPVRTGAVAPGK